METKKTTIIGCGWVGLPLAERMISEGNNVFGSTTDNEKFRSLEMKKIIPFYFDLATNSEIPDIVQKETEILIITIPPINREDYKFYGDQLAKLVDQFKSLKKVVFLSSISVYPRHSANYSEDFEFLEREMQNPIYYAESKLSEIVKDKLIIMRLGGLFGPGRHPALALQGRNDVENPSGTINLVHRNDVIDSLLHVLKADFTGILNVVYPEHPWRKEFYTHVFRKYGLEPINFVISPTVDRQIITTKITKDLGYRFSYSIYDLEEILAS